MQDDFVHIRAPARLHLGFLDPSGKGRRRFGGIGLAIDAPATALSVAHGSRDHAQGPQAKRALAYLDAIRQHLPIPARHYEVAIEEAIPAHAGLGSGTQLALALAAAVRELEGLGPDPLADAAVLGRGGRSGLGAAFLSGGGLAVDGGKREGPDDRPPPVVARLAFPDEWRVILILDRTSEGFHGEDELRAFAELPDFATQASDLICRLVLMQALPAIVERDIEAFGDAIATIQRMVGGHFAPAQGGVFASRRVGSACRALDEAGGHGIGQSSWGPTGFCFAACEREAERLVATLATEDRDHGLELVVVRGRNQGASLGRHPAERRTGTR